jgi:hypothetical protein
VGRLMIAACIGKRVAAVDESPGYSVTLTFEDGTKLEVRQGDGGTMRNPEPYFAVDVLPANACEEWGSFGPCGEPTPCRFHGGG